MKKILTVLTFVLLSMTVHAQAWAVAGAFNSWCNNCDGLYDDGTHGDAVSGDGIFTGQVTVAVAGRYEWKATLWGDWGTNYPGSNSWLITTSPNQLVTFTLNTNTIIDNWMPNVNIVNANDNPSPIVAVGDHQGWNNAGAELMHDDGLNGDLVAGDGIYTYNAVIATPGNYGWKPAVQGSWDCWGQDNRSINSGNGFYTTTIPNQNVYMYLNKNTGRVATSAQSLRLDLTVMIEGLLNVSNSKITPDTVTIELHNSTSPHALVDSKKVLLDSSGYGILYFTATNVVPYWVVVKHRNAIETWSETSKNFISSQLTYDFTWAAGTAYGSNLISKGGKFCLYSGDVSHDGQVTFTDLIAIDNDNTNFVNGYTNTDLTGDLQVTFSDLIIVDNNNTNFIAKVVPTGVPTVKRGIQQPKLEPKTKL